METLVAQVAVIGAGPAGAAAATALATAGTHVVLVDRARFPRDKVCGDGLLPDAFAPLAALGVLEEARRQAQSVRGIRFQAPSGRRGFVSVEGLVIPRKKLDALLVTRAQAAGATFVDGWVLEGFEGEPGRWRAALFASAGSARRLQVTAHSFVLATGASPRPRQLAGLPPAPRGGAAVRAYARLSEPDPSELLIVFNRRRLPRGYYWAFPVEASTFNLGCGVFTTRSHDPSLVDEARRFAAELGAAGCGPLPRGAPLQSSFPHLQLALGNVLAVGEAAGLTRPFSGEGIGPALESGLLAAAALGGPQSDAGLRYRRLLKRRFAREFAAYRWGEHLLGWPWLIDALVRRVEASGVARARVKAVLAAHTSPANILSLRGLGRILLGC